MNDRFYFSTSERSQKARNLAHNANCIVFVEREDEAVILEGVADKIMDEAMVQQFEQSYRDKYGEEVDTGEFHVYSVRPRAAFGFISTAESVGGQRDTLALCGRLNGGIEVIGELVLEMNDVHD